MARNLAEVKSFPARVAPAQKADRRYQNKAEFHEDLAAVEPVDGSALQGGFSKEAVEENSGSSEINAEVEGLPKRAAQPKTKIGSDDHEREQVEGYGADGVFKRLARGMNGIDEILESKPRVLIQKENGRMQ